MNVVDLYNLTSEMKAIFHSLSESGGELTPEVESLLVSMSEKGEEKIAALALIARTFAGAAQFCERDEFRLRDRKSSFRKGEATIREAIVDFMTEAGLSRVKADLVTVSLVSGKPEVLWDRKEESIPEEFRRTYIEHKVDRDAVLRSLDDGRPLPEGMRVKSTSYIQIR